MIKFIRNLLKSEKQPLLGRWGKHGVDIKSIYANYDHCGDTICKNPKLVSDFVKENTKKNKKKL